MIPRIRKNKDENFPDYKWEIKHSYGTDLCKNLWQAFHCWLWICGVPPKIAFWYIRLLWYLQLKK